MDRAIIRYDNLKQLKMVDYLMEDAPDVLKERWMAIKYLPLSINNVMMKINNKDPDNLSNVLKDRASKQLVKRLLNLINDYNKTIHENNLDPIYPYLKYIVSGNKPRKSTKKRKLYETAYENLMQRYN